MKNLYLKDNLVIFYSMKFIQFLRINLRVILSKIITKIFSLIKKYIKRILKIFLAFMRVVKLGYFADRILIIYHYYRKNQLNSFANNQDKFYFKVTNRLNVHYKFSENSKEIMKDLKFAIKDLNS